MDLFRNKAYSGNFLTKSQILPTFSDVNPEKKTPTERQIAQKKSSKIVLIYKNPWVRSKPVGRVINKQVQQKWYVLLRSPINDEKSSEILKLMNEDTCIPEKVMPWIIGNSQKINAKLFMMKRQQYRNCIKIQNPHSIEANYFKSFLHIPQKINNIQLAQLIGTFLIYREDIGFSPLILNLTVSLDYYLRDRPVIIFRLLLTLLSSQTYSGFLTKDPRLVFDSIKFISNNVRKNCTSASFFVWSNLNLEYFIQLWIQNFWLPIAENGTSLRQKILFYLLLYKFSLKSVSKLCESIITSLSHTINQGNFQKTNMVLSEPKHYIDAQFFMHCLLKQQ